MMTAPLASSKSRPSILSIVARARIVEPAKPCCSPDESEPCIVCVGAIARPAGEPIPPRPADVEPAPIARRNGRRDRRYGPRYPRRTREEIELESVARLKTEVEPTRTSVTIGCHMIARFELEPLDDIIAELVRCAADPDRLASLGWPRCCRPWPLSPGEQVAVWRNCKLLALVSIEADGRSTVRRFV
jgi:hypothetical protein